MGIDKALTEDKDSKSVKPSGLSKEEAADLAGTVLNVIGTTIGAPFVVGADAAERILTQGRGYEATFTGGRGYERTLTDMGVPQKTAAVLAPILRKTARPDMVIPFAWGGLTRLTRIADADVLADHRRILATGGSCLVALGVRDFGCVLFDRGAHA